MITKLMGFFMFCEASSAGRLPPPKEEFGRTLSSLIDRGVAVLCVYSGGYRNRYNHKDQLFGLFPALRGRLECLYYRGANHVFTGTAEREQLIRSIDGWCRRRFG